MSNIISMLTETTPKEWEIMSHQDFITNVVETLNMLRSNQFENIIKDLTYPQFQAFAQKCWEEQDQPPEDTNDETLYRQSYDESLPIIILLEKALSIRIQFQDSQEHKQNMAQQLSLLNIILSPHLFDNVAEKINTN